MNKKLIFSLISILAFASLVYFGTFINKKLALSNEQIANSNTKTYTKLIVGTSADFPPFSFRDQNDEIVGFDIDIIKEICRRIQLNIQLVDRPFSMLIPQIQIGQIDAIAAGMTPTQEREKNLRFTKTYLRDNPLVIVTLKDKVPEIKSLSDLKNKNVIVNTGYTADMYISKFPEIQLIRLPKVSDAMMALDHNKAEAFITASLTIEPYQKHISLNNKKEKYNVTEIEGTNESSALGVSKKIPDELFEKIQSALNEMKTDGTLVAIKNRWKIE